MKKLHIAGILVGGFLLAGCNYNTQQAVDTQTTQPPVEKSTESGSMTANGTNVVIYSDKGYAPATLTVKAGTTVTFANEGTGMMWTASALHPTHKALPGFDQLRASGQGSTYNYTFAEVGQWKYHNHVNPSMTGLIIVE